MKHVIGKSYKISPRKIMRKKCISDSRPDLMKDSKTYFCSELAASCLKCLDVLPENVAASSFWPGTFSDKNKSLKLTNDAILEQELII